MAFSRAAGMGSDAVELDVRLTSDGRLIVHHDPKLADGRVIGQTKRSELPAHVPDLVDALDACLPMWVNVEIKNDPQEPDFDPTDDVASLVASALVESGPPSRFLVSSFRRETIDRFHSVAPGIATAFLTADPAISSEPDATTMLDSLHGAGHRAVHPWFGLVSDWFVERAHERDIAVNVWTCDDPEVMSRLAGWGVDGICTNVPDVALATLRG